jgi:hypothetical protein
MILAEKKKFLSALGKIMNHIGHNDNWPGFELGINQSEYDDLNELIQRVHIYNGWFKEDEVRKAFLGISSWLTEDKLSDWLKDYKIIENEPKTVAIIMAGNIPLVGFHDFMSVFLSGNKALLKLSSEDQHLFPALIKIMTHFHVDILDWIKVADSPIKDFDAVIATGSDNSARYFESYFGKYPNIIRKNRSSIAILSGEETSEDFEKLGHDIFDYFGLGCRNVSQLWIPRDFVLDKFFEGIYNYSPIVNHNKYANNYDYNKAVYLLNEENMLDNGFILLKEDESLHSPLGMLHYMRYDDIKEVEDFINNNRESIQAIVGKNYIPFGNSQCPGLSDYADNLDTLKFLTEL